jgi:hypothetical protein
MAVLFNSQDRPRNAGMDMGGEEAGGLSDSLSEENFLSLFDERAGRAAEVLEEGYNDPLRRGKKMERLFGRGFLRFRRMNTARKSSFFHRRSSQLFRHMKLHYYQKKREIVNLASAGRI